MDARIRKALESERTIDITTTGRTSGRPRRIEMWFHNLDGRLYLSGTPGTRPLRWKVKAGCTCRFAYQSRVPGVPVR